MLNNNYSKTKCAVKVNNNTIFFKYEKVVQQVPVKPDIILYVNDIFETIANQNHVSSLDDTHTIRVLMI